MKKWTLILATALTLPTTASAQSDLEQVVSALKREHALGRDGILMHTVGGAGRAYLMANAKLRARGMPPLYCQPPSLSLNGRNYAEIATSHYERDKESFAELWQQMPAFDALVMILGEGLEKTFPCK